jgi:uncharacterized protein YndB with AHSA1/START domain
MIDLTIDTPIARDAAAVFGYVTDPELLPTWQTNTISSVPDGPLAVGTRLRELHRAPGGKQVASVVEVTEYEPGRAFALHVVEGTPVDLRITLAERAGGTLMRFHAFGQLTGVLRLAQPLLQRVLKRQFASQCETLKRLLETQAVPA